MLSEARLNAPAGMCIVCTPCVTTGELLKWKVILALPRQRRDYVRERIVRQPSHTVVVGLARPHLVAGNGRVAGSAGSAFTRVIPRREEAAAWADREVRLPLWAGGGITVQLERRGK